MTSLRTNVLTALAAASLLMAAGCGSNGATGNSASGTAEPTAATEAAATPATGEGGSGATSEPATAPVDVTLKNDGFAKSTPKTFHLPADFTIVVSAKAADAKSYYLRAVPARGAKSIAVPPGGRATGSLPPLKAGESVKLYAGATSYVTISADAEPGP